MKFQPIKLEDIDLFRPYFGALRSRTCDFTVGGVFLWRDFFKMEYAVEDGVLFSRMYGSDGECCYNLPLGGDMAQSVALLADAARAEGRTIKFCTVPEEYIPLFSDACGPMRTQEQRIYFDYLYLAQDLAEFKGKKYAGQRNQISHFLRGVDDWAFVPMDAAVLPAVRGFFIDAFSDEAEMPSEAEERVKVMELLENFDIYGMFGGVLYADSRIVGFSVGETVGDTLYTHIEKADRSVAGAYQMLVRQFAARYGADGVKYINREDDMGDLGLRESKLSYHPFSILKKYTVETVL